MDAAGSSHHQNHESDTTSKRGVKRQADESNDDALRFTKRFNLLSLDSRSDGTSNSNYYVPLTPEPANGASISSHNDNKVEDFVGDGSMNIDDTRHRMYVQNLDAEIAEIEANEPEQRLIFLPDIEKHFSRIPEHLMVTTQDAMSAAQQQELVLYSVPRSLTVDEGHDSVRKAILDARQRARDKATEEARREEMERQYANDEGDAVETAHGYGSGYDASAEVDPDAMDIE